MRVIYSGILTAKTGLHIGAGKADLNSDMPVIKTVNTPFIPGSSLKGAIRSHLERLFLNDCCALGSGGNTNCLSVNDTLQEEYHRMIKNGASEQELRTYLEQHLCFVCKLFGSCFSASKIKIMDSFMIQDMENVEIRDGIAIDRDSGTVSGSAKFDYEVVPAGTQFSFEMIAENITDEEKRLIDIIKQAMEAGRIFIGGMKSRGLGKIVLTNWNENPINFGGGQNA